MRTYVSRRSEHMWEFVHAAQAAQRAMRLVLGGHVIKVSGLSPDKLAAKEENETSEELAISHHVLPHTGDSLHKPKWATDKPALTAVQLH